MKEMKGQTSILIDAPAAKLYDYTQCPHRVWRDIHGPQDEKVQETNPFVQPTDRALSGGDWHQSPYWPVG